MKIINNATGEFLEIEGTFNGTEFMDCLHALNYSSRLIDNTYIVECSASNETRELIGFLIGEVINNEDEWGKRLTIHSPFIGTLEIFNKF